MDSVEGALNVRKKKTDFFVVVEVVQPFAGEEGGEVLAAMSGSKSVLVSSVSVCFLKVRYECQCEKAFYGFGKDGGEVDSAVVSGVACGLFLVEWS